MDRTEIEKELRSAGAETVKFRDSYGYLVGIGVTVGDKRHAVAWDDGPTDEPASGVAMLKEWLAKNAVPQSN